MVRPVAFTASAYYNCYYYYYLTASSVLWSCRPLSLVAGLFRVAPLLTLRNRPSLSSRKTTTTTVVLVTSVLFATTTTTTRSFITTTTQALELPKTTRTTSTPSSSSSSFRSHNPTNEPPMVDHNNNNLGYLNAADAAALDEELMSTPGYQLEQLMELAGLAVAEAVHQVAMTTTTATTTTTNDAGILVICGPGNNGGDGLVAARHLYMFGWTNICIVYPALTTKRVKHPHYTNLISQCRDLGITITDTMPDHHDSISLSQNYSIIIDAIFGFSFRGDPRPPYDTILEQLKSLNGNPNVTTVAVDVPSGWNVDGEDDDKNVSPSGRYHPNVLVSLTAPKQCARSFTGRHFVGGRFVPPALAQAYKISMPPYPGVAQVMEITTRRHQSTTPTPTTPTPTNTDRSWEVEYAKYLAEQEREPTTLTMNQPTKLDDMMTWEAQYAAYCAEKEARLAKAERRGDNDHESTS